MNPIFFVHIPKTAGTSFRVAAENYFGESSIIADYGGRSARTSTAITHSMYDNLDPYNLYQHMRNNDINLLTGHVNYERYGTIFSCLNVASFIRNPIEQVVSHFEHYVRHHDYDGDLESFISEERFCNIQSKMLSPLPVELYGFIGITEQYNDSIDLFNSFYNTNLNKLSLNTKVLTETGKPIFDSIEELGDEMLSRILEINNQDVQRYESAKKVIAERMRMCKAGMSYDFGFAYLSSKTQLWGVAFGSKQETALEIEVLLNNELVTVAQASESRPHMRHLNTPRRGYVGFSHTFSEPVIQSDCVVCRIKGTGQIIMS